MKLNWIERVAYELLRVTDIENRTLRSCVRRFSRSVGGGARVLDAGAGLHPYMQFFSHCRYESCDFQQCDEFYSNITDARRQQIARRHTYVCPIDKIPVAAATYDVILCTQVLEHVPYPANAIAEFERILKPSGRLFLTVPQGYGIHGEPFNFFYFTKYGLALLLSDGGFEDITTVERGGYFYYLYDRLAYAIPRVVMGYKRWRLIAIAALLPLHILLAYVLGPVLLLLEPLDLEKRFTLGYVATATKRRKSRNT